MNYRTRAEAEAHGLGHVWDEAFSGPSRVLPIIAEALGGDFDEVSRRDTKGSWTVVIDGWHPPKLNQLMSGHWAKAAKLKKAANGVIRRAVYLASVPVALGRRRIKISVYVEGRGRRPDPDAFLKATLDALKHSGRIIDDSQEWCEWERPLILSGTKRTEILIEDIGK